MGSLMIYSGLVLVLGGLGIIARPTSWPGLATRASGLLLAGAGLLMVAVAWFLPVSESRTSSVRTRLDEFVPVWQFREFHTIRIAAPPSRVFDAIKHVRADEIVFFRTLTWIRRGGQSLPPGILNAPNREPLIDVALKGGFVRLAEDPPHELVIGTVVAAPPGTHGPLTAEVFQRDLSPGFALAAMNFVVAADGVDGSLVSTETRVCANSPSARRRFAVYWRIIYPGSAMIRRMWLRAIARRATNSGG